MIICVERSLIIYGQVEEMLNYLAQYKIKAGGPPPGSYGRVWLDIEGTQYWGSQTSNREFFNGLVSALKSHGQVRMNNLAT